MDGSARLSEILRTLGVAVPGNGPDDAPGLQVDVGGRRLDVAIEEFSLVDQPRALSIIGAYGRMGGSEGNESIHVVVGERIVAGARDLLRGAGHSWCDLRGHLYLTGPGLLVDTDFSVDVDRPGPARGITGRVPLGTAIDLLLHGSEVSGVREIARRIGAAPSSVSVVLKSLREEGLADKSTVDQESLFWAVADAWKPQWTPVQGDPGSLIQMRTPALRLGFDGRADAGWALSGDLAAAQLGAPIALGGNAAPDLYLPTRTSHRLALSMLRPATTDGFAARVALAPAAAVCEQRVDVDRAGAQTWLLARPLFIALDLAQDPGRGQEILRAWTPEEGGSRVW